ncbi:MAG: hypothetical protein AAFN79_14250 [Pseudomonadota bacterium]
MAEEKRLSITFGDFSCEIVGYDEPFSILSKVVDVINATRRTESGQGESSPGVARRSFSEALKENAAAFDLTIAQINGRFIVSSPDMDAAHFAEAEIAADAVSVEAAPTATAPRRSPLNLMAVEPVDASKWEAPVAEAEGEDEVLADLDETIDISAEEPQDEDVADVLALGSEQIVFDAKADVPEEEIVVAEEAAAETEETADDAEVEETQEGVAEETAETEEVAAESQAEKEAASVDEPAEIAVVKPAPPRIVVDKTKTAAANRARVSVNTTVVKAGATEEPADDAADEVAASERKRRRVTVQKVVRAPEESLRDEVKEDDENFLFAGDDLHGAADEAIEPLTLTSAEQVETDLPEATEDEELNEARDAETATDADAAPKRKRGGLNLGIFRRFAAKDDEEATEQADDDAGFGRLRETAEAELPRLEESNRDPLRVGPEPKLFAVSDGSDHHDANSPATFARQMGAQSLQDLLEASAAFVSIVEGKAQFSRRDVMQALSDIGIEKDYTPEARLKTFRKLVTAGAIIRSDDGMFAISHATRFGYETQLRARG